MSTRSTLRPNVVISNGDMSTSSITSLPTILQSLSMANYSVVWTNGSSPIGTLAVQASNDYAVGADGVTVLNAGTWNTLPLDLAGASVTSIPISGNSGNGMIDMDGIAFYAIRLIYTRSSGSGTLTATITGKVS